MLRQIIKISVILSTEVNRFDHTGHIAKIHLLPNRTWKEIPFTLSSLSFSEKSKREAAGVYYEQKLSIDYKKLPPNYFTFPENLCRFLLQSNHYNFFVRIEYTTGEVELLGTHDFPTVLNVDIDLKKSTIYNIEFNCKTIYRLLTLSE